jgi:hypothetical protein
MVRFFKELGTDPDVQEVADEIPSLHRLLKLWIDPSALLADSAPDVEAIQEKMKKLEQVHQAYATKLEAERHFWDQFRRFMKTRRDKCRDVHMYLRQTAEELIKTKELPPYVWLDPVVIPLTAPCYLYPLNHREEAEEAGYTPDFLGIMKYEEENMHHRTF